MDKIKFVTTPSNAIAVAVTEDTDLMEGSVDVSLNGIKVLYFNPNYGTVGSISLSDGEREALESQGIQFGNENRIKIKEG